VQDIRHGRRQELVERIDVTEVENEREGNKMEITTGFSVGDNVTDGVYTGEVKVLFVSCGMDKIIHSMYLIENKAGHTHVIKGEDTRLARPTLEEAWAKAQRLIAFLIQEKSNWFDGTIDDDDRKAIRAEVYKVIGTADNGFGSWTPITDEIKAEARTAIALGEEEYNVLQG